MGVGVMVMGVRVRVGVGVGVGVGGVRLGGGRVWEVGAIGVWEGWEVVIV
eukprot:CAMPEP_0173262374 /NCGR_PEP_ID=MMETSP1142-20121109/26739_1 /TAXON_ID=483371 /ORGANISM="non described non described, Strain CCMP2298" /LENGTH=49 /DNA_ID=CAMNT_0014197505 /DNA_START=1112 /DNA_END=1261 /DNA_ORIENTATION=+